MQGVVGQEAIGVKVLQVTVLLVMVLKVVRRVFEVGCRSICTGNNEVMVGCNLWLLAKCGWWMVGSGWCRWVLVLVLFVEC